MMDTFEADWAAAETPVVGDSAANDTTTAEEVTEREATKKAVKIFVKELGPLTTTVRKAVKRAVANAGEAVLEDKTVKTSLKKVVKKAVKGAVNDAVNDLKKP